MSLRCLLRRHQPMLTSIVQRDRGYAALCDRCGMPIERSEAGRWAVSEPLISRSRQAA